MHYKMSSLVIFSKKSYLCFSSSHLSEVRCCRQFPWKPGTAGQSTRLAASTEVKERKVILRIFEFGSKSLKVPFIRFSANRLGGLVGG